MHDPRLTVTYRPEIVAPVRAGFSRSPLKPALWMQHVSSTSLAARLDVRGDFGPVGEADLLLAHHPSYVDAFLSGRPRVLARSSGNGWSRPYRDSVLMKVGALVRACELAVSAPERGIVCPTSGDHHARPAGGGGFCPIAGQVISALRLHRTTGARTAWVDLDEHFGNSIPDCAAVHGAVRDAIPIDVNPQGTGSRYLDDLGAQLERVEAALVGGRVELVCVGHGADSHEWDELGGSVNTAEWVQAGRATYEMVRRASRRLGRPVPVVTTFFGGYREDDYASVLELHTADVAAALDALAGVGLDYAPAVRRPEAHRPGVDGFAIR